MTELKKEESKNISHNPLVFISHDTRDAEIAEEFSTLIKRVSAGVLKSFRSSDKKGTQGIEFGVEWYPEIIKNIQNATDVVCLLTPNSVDRPWILFEAGMAKGKLSTPILGIALGIPLTKASTGPFAQFQNCGDNEDALCKLIFQLVDRIPNSEPDNETIKFHVQKFKVKIDEIFKKRKEEPESTDIVTYDEDASAKLFEEIKVMFQDLPSRIENNIRFDYTNKRKRRRFHPMMIEELMHMNKSPKISLLISLGMLREKLPWLYDYGIETIRTIESNVDPGDKLLSIDEFEQIVELSTRHPIMRDYIDEDSKEDYMMMRELPMMITENLRRLMKK